MAHAVDIAIGNRVRQFRISRKMSQTALGKHLGVSFQQIQKYEKGANRMGASRLIQICDALDISVGDLFDGIESPDDARGRTLLTSASIKVARDWERIKSDETKTAVRQFIHELARV